MHIPLSRSGLAFGLLVASCRAQQPDLTDLNLDDLAKVQVTSVSHKSESLTSAPAAIYVLTGETIRQGGFTQLVDALRTIPGLYVAQTDDHYWQVSARGFSDVFNNKMQLLVDGRSQYSQFLGGVYWDALDIPIENIDRIEVIRGPGGTLWGANAVNGVINIITKPAVDAQGVMVSSSIDPEQGIHHNCPPGRPDRFNRELLHLWQSGLLGAVQDVWRYCSRPAGSVAGKDCGLTGTLVPQTRSP